MFKIEDAWSLSQPLWTSKLRSKTALITDFYEQRRLSISSKGFRPLPQFKNWKEYVF